MKRRQFLGVVSLIVLTGFLLTTTFFSRGAGQDEIKQWVRLIIDYGDGVQKHFPMMEWKAGMTVEDLMKAAKTKSHGITYELKPPNGTGASFFIEKLDDLQNEGYGPTKKNWLYSVNFVEAQVGAGVFKLNPNDVVLWKFDIYQETKKK